MKHTHFAIIALISVISSYGGGYAVAEEITHAVNVSGTAGLSCDLVKAVNVRAEKTSEQIAPPKNVHDQWAQGKAAEFASQYNSPEFQQRVHDETERLKKDIFGKPIEEYYKDDKALASIKNDSRSTLATNERVYVFVSSSMPLQTIRNYARAIDKAGSPNVVMVLRGFIDGLEHINSTLIFASHVLSKDPACDGAKSACPTYTANLQIDPLLFRRYQVTEVPAVVYASNVRLLNVGGSEGIEGNAFVQQFYKVMGDAALDYHVETINKEVHQKSLQGLVEAMRRGFYQ